MATRLDVHQHVTDQIIAAIEAGTGSWEMPWHRPGAQLQLPVNVESNKHYNGINILNLWFAAEAKGYGSHLWGTYRQWVRRVSRMKGVTSWVREQCPALSPHPACRAGNGAV